MLTHNEFVLPKEGVQIFRIYETSYNEDFGKIDIKMVNAQGCTFTQKYSILDNNGEVNDKAMASFSYFAKVCLDDMNADEIDTDDLVDRYIEVDIVYNEYPSKDDPSKMVKFANLGKTKNVAKGFVDKPCDKALNLGKKASKEDLLGLLDD